MDKGLRHLTRNHRLGGRATRIAVCRVNRTRTRWNRNPGSPMPQLSIRRHPTGCVRLGDTMRWFELGAETRLAHSSQSILARKPLRTLAQPRAQLAQRYSATVEDLP